MNDRWECRYSSCEMVYLDIVGRSVRCYLDHSPGSADVYTFDEVLAEKADGVVNGIFTNGTLEELKAAVKAAQGR